MSQKITCREAQQQLTQIKTLEAQLREIVLDASADALTSEERKSASQEARRIKTMLETQIMSLQEQVNPFERLFNLKEQYQSQMRVLETAKILETKEINGEKVRGFTDIEGEFQPIPTRREVIERLFEKKELLEVKQTQGFGKIRLVPFGMSLEDLAKRHKQVLIKKAQEGKLFTARKDQNNSNEVPVSLDLNLDDPMSIADEYTDADKNGTLVYHPTSLTPENHGGYTKREILKQRREKRRSGWDITILEDNLNIPRKGIGEEIGGRAQIETAKSPEEYLQLLQTPEYKGEVGLTPEESLLHAITELVENNEVIDDAGGNGSFCYSIGAYFPMNSADDCGRVPSFGFTRGRRRVVLNSYEDGIIAIGFGVRFGVRV